MSSSPILPSPDGDRNQTQALMGMTIAMLSLSIIFVILRFIVRISVLKSVWWDDWTIFFALVGTIVGAGLDFVEFDKGYGRHRYYIDGPSYSRLQYYSYGEWIQTFATLMWTKISICLFLSRIPATRTLKTPLYIAVVVLFISNLILTLLWILQCLPVKATWDYTVSGKCFSKAQLLEIILAQGSEFTFFNCKLRTDNEVVSAISDFMLAAYPILLLARVQISLRKKLGLYLLMGLGVITGACCIVRNVLNWTNESTDSTWDSIPNWMWRCLEVNFGIAAACLPAIYPGYRSVRRHFGIRSSQRYPSGGKGDSDKARIWHDVNKTTRDTSTTAGAMALDGAAAPGIPMPEAAILMSNAFGVQRESNPRDSAERLVAGSTDTRHESTEEGTGPAARWEHGNALKATTSSV